MSLSFSEVWPDSGVDEGSTSYPRALMVPAAGANLVMLKGAGTDLSFKPDSHFTVVEIKSGATTAIKTAKREVPGLAMPSKSQDAAGAPAKDIPGLKLDDALNRAKSMSARLVLVEGKRRGFGELSVKSGREEASMKVCVRDGKTLLVSFHFLEDIGPDGKSRRRSTWNEAWASHWMGLLNQIYTPQTNITFKLQTAAPLPIKQSLPVRLDLKRWQSLSIKPPSGAAVNIFLVGNWIGDPKESFGDPFGSFIRATKHILVDDRKTHDEIVTTMAHEIGHFLGASVNFGHPDAAEKTFLMTTVDWRVGAHIPQEYAQHFNPI
jgi:hypothetical protein